jgi:hypothetical protein
VSGGRVTYAYAAPEGGYPGRACRVCGHRPCVVRLGWGVGWGAGRASGYAHFCAEHTGEANRASRALRGGEVPHRLAPPWGPAAQGAGAAAVVVGR